MKRYFQQILVLCLSFFLLCGCSYGGDVAEETPDGSPALKIGIDASYEPYTYVDENGDYTGLDIRLAKEACRRMGRNPEFIAIKWDNKDNYLSDGSIDCIWSCFSINGREDDYRWVGPYMYSRQVVAVRSDSKIQTLSDLDQKSVAVMTSTKPESIFLNRSTQDIPDVKNVYCLADMDLVFSALKYGYVDAAAGHESVMQQYIDTANSQYRLLDDTLLSAKVGVAFSKDRDDTAASELEAALDAMKNDGTLQSILEEYGIQADETGGDSE